MKAKSVFLLFCLLFALSVAFPQTAQVPQRTDENVIVASYKIKWIGEAQHDFDKLAQVIENFDVCGIIEVKSEAALAELVKSLEAKSGKDWGYVFGVRTHRPSGTYHEAYGAVWRKDRVELGDGLISGVWDQKEKFRNDPFIVSFRRKNFDFSLVLIHTRWTDDDEGTREGEVAAIAEQIFWLRGFLAERDIILAGDFNYSGRAEPMISTAEYAELTQIDPNDKSTFKSDYSGYSSPYDHIYISESDTREFIQGSSGVLDTTRLVYGSGSAENMKKSKQELSDHLPVWAVFNVSLSDDD
ncbi:MAG: endonuclease/exonuclease/phosphatase family protein [Acidobacteriota bacterium]